MHPALVTVVVVALVLVVVVATVHVVPIGSRALVMRWGLVSRVAGPGVVRVVPGLDRVRVLDLQPHRMEPVPVTATTRDGFDVRLDLSVLWRVLEPERSLRAVPDVAVATADAVEHASRQVIGETELCALVAERVSALAGVDARASAVAQEWGVAVLDVDALDVELRAGPELGRLLGYWPRPEKMGVSPHFRGSFASVDWLHEARHAEERAGAAWVPLSSSSRSR